MYCTVRPTAVVVRDGEAVQPQNRLWDALPQLTQLTALTMVNKEPGHYDLLLPQAADARFGCVEQHFSGTHYGLYTLPCLKELRAPGATLGGQDKMPYRAREPGLSPDMSQMLLDSLEEVELGLTTDKGLQELLKLPSLHSLVFQRAVRLTGWQLLLLEGMYGGVGCLTSLQLHYCPTDAMRDPRIVGRTEAEQAVNRLCDTMEVHAAHWPALPLRSLSIDTSAYNGLEESAEYDVRPRLEKVEGAPFSPVDSPIMHSLGQLTSLTAVSELTGLQELRLAGGFEPDWSALDDGDSGDVWNIEWREECLDGMQMLMHAVGRLPQLHHLVLQRLFVVKVLGYKVVIYSTQFSASLPKGTPSPK
ncbi:hypothetical protein COO60DRAFT_1632547 [Scenedesmus sp. NREL 46B-D3]|nr:hypothetical protein COO60DRAFT_1632547 [Scenedesmus sp. NREL 46B-D3]